MSKGTGKRPTNGVGNYMEQRVVGIIGDPEGSREQRRAAKRMSRGNTKGGKRSPGGAWQPRA